MEGGRGEKGICACNWKRQGHTNLIFNRGTLVTTCILKGHGGSRCKTVYCAPRWLLAGRALSASREPLSAVHVAFLKNKIEGLRAILLFSFSPSLLLNPSPPPLNHPLIFSSFFFHTPFPRDRPLFVRLSNGWDWTRGITSPPFIPHPFKTIPVSQQFCSGTCLMLYFDHSHRCRHAAPPPRRSPYTQ